MFSKILVGYRSVSFDTDPDSGSSHFLIRIRILGNDTDSTDTDSTDPDPHTDDVHDDDVYKDDILADDVQR